MIHTLLSNRMEELVNPLAQLLAMPVTNPLTPDVIMVQHQGMQHWLSMELAQHPERQVAMNLAYPLPAVQMWALIRRILGPDQVPEQSLYQREVMVWRLYDLLASDGITRDDAFAEPNRYWQQQSGRQQAPRRFELAGEVADLFEQYLLYRPDWIEAWDGGEGDHWQARLWRTLSETEPQHPVRLIRRARERLSRPAEALPERLFLFGINSLPPVWLDFIRALSDHGGVDFHILCLNPSDEYWGDLVSDKQAARQRARWIQEQGSDDGLILDVGNPLIGSLGRQGQTFVHQLMERADLETTLFAHPVEDTEQDTLLNRLQADVLELVDGRDTANDQLDQSIEVVSAHSALREVQGLHDWLLHRFNEDPTLTPRDVLVMCPNVEDYAPFVEAVFARRFDDIGENVPPLPSSIADRSLSDSDPTVAAFLELLTLPDARFQVNQVMSWLQVPAIRERLELSGDDIEQIAQWLEAACVHWGLDASQKDQWTGEGNNARYTWGEGLERLLLGFAWGDEETIVGERLLLPQVEGGDAIILGKLLAFISELRRLARDLREARPVADWQGFLHQRLRLALFASESDYEPAHDDLRGAIRELSEHAHRAGFTDAVPLPVVRRVIEQALGSSARTGRQFLTGQVTVCSMVPMRSIPFRIIAVLGLNDGEFPRQRPPLGFDLMAADKPRAGDRSRRGDDRYLFLEAILSARDALYLSYQGRDVRTNTEQPPSLVLSELLHYLEGRSGWSRSAIRELPLQPFSRRNYTGACPSFDGNWLRLAQHHPQPENVVDLPEPEEWPERVDVDSLVRALEHPARHFARTRLGLFLEQRSETELADAEPFATSHLDRHRVQQQLVEARLTGDGELADWARRRFMLSGEAPDHGFVEAEIDEWDEQSQQFVAHLRAEGAGALEPEAVTEQVDGIDVEAELPRAPEGQLVFWRLANAKSRDKLRLWLHHLIANCQGQTSTCGLFRGKDNSVDQLTLAPLSEEEARTQLADWVALWKSSHCQPLAQHADLGFAMAAKGGAGGFSRVWDGDWYRDGLGADPYMAWFWPSPPDPQMLYEALSPRYDMIEAHMETETHNPEVAHD